MKWPCDYFPPTSPCLNDYCEHHLYSVYEDLIDQIDHPSKIVLEFMFCDQMIDRVCKLKEIADHYHVTRERVRQIENSGWGHFIKEFQREDKNHFDQREKERIVKLLAGKITLHHRVEKGGDGHEVRI